MASCVGLSCLRQENPERRPLSRDRLHFHLAVVHLYRAIYHRQTNATALRLGREVQIEDALQILRIDPDTGIRDQNRDAMTAKRLASDLQWTSIRHRLAGVQRKVQEGLPEHGWVTIDVGRAVP